MFERFFRKGSKSGGALEPHEATIALLLLAMSSDGSVQQQEGKKLYQILARVPFLPHLSDQQFEKLRKKIRLHKAEHDRQWLLAEAARCLPAHARPASYALVLEMVMADGVLHRDEQNFLQDLQRALGLPGSVQRKIYQAVQSGGRLVDVVDGSMQFDVD